VEQLNAYSSYQVISLIGENPFTSGELLLTVPPFLDLDMWPIQENGTDWENPDWPGRWGQIHHTPPLKQYHPDHWMDWIEGYRRAGCLRLSVSRLTTC
jgi:hypothetical protein